MIPGFDRAVKNNIIRLKQINKVEIQKIFAPMSLAINIKNNTEFQFIKNILTKLN